MKVVTTFGVDIAKTVFQIHGIDAEGKVIFRRKLKRCDFLAFFTNLHFCLIGMEACSSAHHWGRELTKLGHNVKLMPAVCVKPYRKVAAQGDAAAQYTLGEMYERGLGITVDTNRAAQSFAKSIRSGSKLAINRASSAWGITTAKKLQKILHDAGAYDGAIDGKVGYSTREDMRRYLKGG